MVVGKTVSITMPDAAVISGVATAVQPDALVLVIKKTSNAHAYPKGQYSVPRATLHAVELRTKTARYRIIGTTVGGVLGTVGGFVAAAAICGWGWDNSCGGGAAAAGIGIAAGSIAGGYFLGNAADRRSTMIVIDP